jgi:hypothetical protein
MAVNRKERNFYIVMATIVLLAAAVYLTETSNRIVNKKTTDPKAVLPSPPKDTLPQPDSTQWLADSTRLFLIGKTHTTTAKTYPVQRKLQLDGNAFLEVPDASQSLVVQTKLLTLSVFGKAAFLVMAPAKEEWAEVQVLSGTIIAKKAYLSQFDEPDTLRGNQMLMLNRTIDLMEKEKFDATDLKAWRSRLP